MQVVIAYGDRRHVLQPRAEQPEPARDAVGFPAAWTATAATAATMLAPRVVQAAGVDTTDLIMRAFEPLISLVQGLAYPICFLMVSGGFLLIMTGNRTRGIDLIRWAGVGYIGLQFAPALMRVLVEVGEAMRQAQQMP